MRTATLACCLCLLIIPATAQESLVFGSHHRGWADSLAKRIEILFVVDEEGLIDAQEIAAQIDAKSHFFERDGAESDDELSKELSRVDVVVFSTQAWHEIPISRQAIILDKVSTGLGLVVLGREANKVSLSDEADWSQDPVPGLGEFAYAPSFDWQAAHHGEGRILVGTNPVDSEFHKLVPVIHAPSIHSKRHYDYQLSDAVRGIVWATGHSSGVHIKSIEHLKAPPPSVAEIPPHLPAEYMQYMADAQMKSTLDVIQLELEAPSEEQLSVSVRVRREDDPRPWEAYDIAFIPEGSTYAIFHLPLGRGSSLLDVWVTQDRKTLDWKSARVNVERWPMLEGAQFSRQLVNRNDSIDVTYEVRQNLFSPEATFAHLSVTDSLGRIIAYSVHTIPPEGGQHTSRIAWSDALTRLLNVDVFLSRGNSRELSPVERRMASQAQTQVVVQGLRPDGLQWVIPHAATSEPYNHGFLAQARGNGVTVIHSGFGGGTETAAVEANLRSLVTYPKLSESLGDDAACFATSRWRQQQFEIASSWSKWATGLGIRDVTIPWTIADTRLCECSECTELLRDRLKDYYPNLNALNRSWNTDYSNWSTVKVSGEPTEGATQLDLERARIDLVNHADSTVLKLLSELIPKANPTVIAQNMSWAAGTRVSQFGASFAHDDSASSLRHSSYRNTKSISGLLSSPNSTVQLPWLALFDGHASIHTDPDSIKEESLLDSLSQARDGIDTLLMNCQAQAPVIAIYENIPTWLAASQRDRHVLRRTHSKIIRTLNKLALPHQFYSYEQLMNTDSDQPNIILLPRTIALSGEERKALKALSLNGVRVITDTDSGHLNEHGNPFDGPQLEIGALIDFNDPESLSIALESDAEELSLERSSPPGNDSKTDATTEWRKFRFGAAEIFMALQRDMDQSERPEIRLDENKFGFDLIAAAPLGSRRQRLHLNNWGVSLLTVLPYRVSRVLLETPEVVAAGQRLPFRATVKSYDDLPNDHLLEIQLRDPQGEVMKHYEATLVLEDGTGESYIPLALNESPGDYTIHVRDLFSGITTTATVTII